MIYKNFDQNLGVILRRCICELVFTDVHSTHSARVIHRIGVTTIQKSRRLNLCSFVDLGARAHDEAP
jgi:hypothetical protein